MDEALIKKIVETVLLEMKAQTSHASCCTEGMDKLLVIGDAEAVPPDIAQKYEVLSIEDFKQFGNVQRYKRILITHLTLTQMSDIAHGRDASPEAEAVITGILSGLEVYMTETAFSHKKYAGKSSSRLYDVIENNAAMIQSFGVKLLRECRTPQQIPARPPKYQAPKGDMPKTSACVNSDKLITEDKAAALTADGQKNIIIARDSIVTPSAWDVFRQRGVSVAKGDKK